MTSPSELQRLGPTARAQLIYGAARQGNELALWRAALGRTDPAAKTAPVGNGNPLLDFQSLLQALSPQPVVTEPNGEAVSSTQDSLSLGANQALAPQIEAAAERTHLPPAALAAIVDAESAKSAGGAWNGSARNPRSTATGLGQFLNHTWIGEAERSGTFLHQLAAARGWLGSDGRVAAAAREPLLALRTDPAASINAVADYARANLDRLARHGLQVGSSVEAVARTAWLAHHLGAGDAQRFLTGGLTDSRSSQLLSAQVGAASAGRRIAAAGDASSAHRQWLLSYLDRHLTPDKFTT
ncbi:peptidoglycan-binding protein [Sphingomonas sp. KRR8]|uniref:peptidoglycan-binding protein n=1 Tax=Sphingomonas sp. KRR8 TaxID=2942996 RepID=UPI00201FBFA5|nr:peptidoglycan-binding protein [Sphingomonas sp. KRR8]URD61391.1 peptidoglycan-binding protein [Sphingomonas sp. KRR8]